jgi:hypothetical protein
MEHSLPFGSMPTGDEHTRDHADALAARERSLRLRGQDDHGDAEDDGASLTGLERGRGAGRRLSEFSRAAEEGELTSEQFLFLRAIDDFKRVNQKTYPSWTDVLEVVRLLGYRKVQASVISLRGVSDWQEKPDAPAGVRPRNWEQRFGGDGSGEGPQGPQGPKTGSGHGGVHGAASGKGKKKAA